MSSDNLEKICALRNQFDDLCKRHSDDESFVDAVKNVCKDFDSSEKIKQNYHKDRDLSRLLRIGIVGKVKAGKSSLLNALFFNGKDILPKAATPMTAALTYLEYGEQLAVTVEFFTEEDIAELKNRADDYEKQLKQKIEDEYQKLKKLSERSTAETISDEDIKNNARTCAESSLRKNEPLSAAFDQYQRILKADALIREEIKAGKKDIPVTDIGDIGRTLTDYVGESGSFMPFTRNVNIRLPLENLKEITIVDTPGFNDPVPSRNDKARELLNECDVVLILGLTSQFITAQDKDILSNITTKKGITELFVVATQFDSAILGPEIIEESNEDLHKAIDICKEKIRSQIEDIFSSEVNEDGVFNLLINERDTRVFHSSGLCQSLLDSWDQKEDWDAGRKKVWENLSGRYPDYFSDGDKDISKKSLSNLANIDAMHNSIQSVKKNKEKIFADKIQYFEQKYIYAAQECKKRITEYIETRQNAIREDGGDLDKIKKEIAELHGFIQKTHPHLKNIFEDTLYNWNAETRKYLENILISETLAVKAGVTGAEDTAVRLRETGFWLWKKSYSETYSSVKTARVKNAIGDYIEAFNDVIVGSWEDQENLLVTKLQSEIGRFWLENSIEDGVSVYEIRNAVRSLVKDAMIALTAYQGKHSFSSETGILTDNSAEVFVDQAGDFVCKLKDEFSQSIKETLKKTTANLEKSDFAGQILKKYENILEVKKREVEEPQKALENFDKLKKEVQEIVCPI